MAWIESHAELRDHPKTDHLLELLELSRRETVGLLHFIWWRALTYAPDGDLSSLTDGQIATWAAWEGDASLLVEALTAAGFLDDERHLHDWYDYAGRWIERREANAERMRQARRRSSTGPDGARAEHVHETSGARVQHVQGLPDLTGPNLTGPNPQPPYPPSRTAGRRRAADAAGSKPAERSAKRQQPAKRGPPRNGQQPPIPTEASAYTSGEYGQLVARRMAAKAAKSEG